MEDDCYCGPNGCESNDGDGCCCYCHEPSCNCDCGLPCANKCCCADCDLCRCCINCDWCCSTSGGYFCCWYLYSSDDQACCTTRAVTSPTSCCVECGGHSIWSCLWCCSWLCLPMDDHRKRNEKALARELKSSWVIDRNARWNSRTYQCPRPASVRQKPLAAPGQDNTMKVVVPPAAVPVLGAAPAPVPVPVHAPTFV